MKIRVMGICLLVLTLLGAFALMGCGECEHSYDHVCDTVCNLCGYERTVSGHTYDNACDARCNKCNAPREVGEHVYSAVCDADCDICGAKREAYHTYDNACDTLCNICNGPREVDGHVYENECDSDCNECGFVREVSGHEYSYACDVSCNVCGGIREAEEHTYSGGCDRVCNVCGDDERAVTDEHSFVSNCDTQCNVCGEKTEPAANHSYSSACDVDCDACGEVRTNVQHSWGAWRSNGDATCEEDGTKTRKCSVCKTLETDIEVGSATGHYYLGSDGYSFNNDATHLKDGTESRKCYLCDNPDGTRPAIGTAGHCFDKNGKCKECGWYVPDLSAYMVYGSFEEYQYKNQSFYSVIDRTKTTGMITAETRKTGVTYTIVSRGNPADSNLRALKIERAASQNETGNDTIVDVAPTYVGRLTAKHVIEFEIMIGSGNGTNIYLNGRKEKSGSSAVFNQFVWYNDAYKSVLIGNTTLVDGVEDNVWYRIALAIDDEAKTYDIYVEGVKALSGISYVKSAEYYSFSECAVGCYRFTANKGKGAVEFYLDNITVYNGEYRA